MKQSPQSIQDQNSSCSGQADGKDLITHKAGDGCRKVLLQKGIILIERPN